MLAGNSKISHKASKAAKVPNCSGDINRAKNKVSIMRLK